MTEPRVLRYMQFNPKLSNSAWGNTVSTALPMNFVAENVSYGHISPYSTYIAAMGPYWEPGCLEAVREMAYYASSVQGGLITLSEEADRCYHRFDAMGLMRNLAYMRAIRQGYEYILYVDNDVKPGPEVLLRLLQRDVPVVAPIVVYTDNNDYGLGVPKMKQGQGLVPLNSCVLSFILFKLDVFLPWAATGFWENPIGADEGYHFAKLAMIGHRPYIDTDVVVECVRPPHFPLANRPTDG